MFLTIVVPFERAANNKMRFDRDLDPGSLTCPSILVIGCNTSCSMATSAGLLEFLARLAAKKTIQLRCMSCSCLNKSH